MLLQDHAHVDYAVGYAYPSRLCLLR
jgi:hypothetical protein